MKVLLVVDDGHQLRSFHERVFDDIDQRTLRFMAANAIARADQLVPKFLENDAHLQVGQSLVASANSITASASTLTQGELARVAGFSGNTCEQCGSLNMKQTGTCETCQDCGWNKGCG